jgi:hypothetical protein
MTYFNRLVLSEEHREHFNFSTITLKESQAIAVIDHLRMNLPELVRNAFVQTCERTEGLEEGMLKIDSIYTSLNYHTDELRKGIISTFLSKFMHIEKQFYRLRFDILYEVVVEESFNRNYLKLKDYDLYNRIYSKEFNARMYINFYTMLGTYLYRWKDEDQISMTHGPTLKV